MRSIVLLACLFATAGCVPQHGANTDPPPPPVAPDGSWHGTTTRFQADSRHCPSPSLLDFPVFNSSFDYRWMGGIRVPVSIAPDGTLSGSDGSVTIKGKITGSRMEGDATSAACGLHFTATKTS
jgi:hypothetical protein